MSVAPDATAAGQESVWSYPRPAIAQRCLHHLRVVHRDIVVADTHNAVRTLETSHPPCYYFPRADVAMVLLRASKRRSMCEWKGPASYFDVVIEGDVLHDVAWNYPNPTAAFTILRDLVAFYPSPFDACLVDGERVRAQPGGFYGGWISSGVAGPFKGVPGSWHW